MDKRRLDYCFQDQERSYVVLRENQTRGHVLKQKEIVTGNKKTLSCLKTQIAQGKLHSGLKNEVPDKAKFAHPDVEASLRPTENKNHL